MRDAAWVRALLACVILGVGATLGAVTTDDAKEMAGYLREADAICRSDGGALWGVSLCGPLLLADPATRRVFANEPDNDHLLSAQDGVFVGTLPGNINIANMAVDWTGKRWTMARLPLPGEPHRRARLLAHEMWHRIQDRLGLPASGAANHHLDTRDGRYWLQLEWRALARALIATAAEQRQAIVDAGLFRARRRQLFPSAAEEERSMEINEGLAEYTGVRLSGAADRSRFVIDENLKPAVNEPTFVRSFAYATGPAYGLLLDMVAPDWRKRVSAQDDLAELLLKLGHLELPGAIEAVANDRAGNYDGAALAKSEEEREQKRVAREKSYRSRLIDGPVLTIPLQKMNMQFDPGNLVPLEGFGTVYPEIRIVDSWGVLEVKRNGALLSGDFRKVIVPAPAIKLNGSMAEGDGWRLELKSGWKTNTGNRPGDYVVKKD
jgi:hypothetical protein